MKLLTKAIEAKLAKAPLYSQEKVENPEIIVKFFTPWSNWTWFVTEGSKEENGDYRFFGMVHGQEKELGYFMLSELEELRGPGGLKIERDKWFEGQHLNDIKQAA